MGKPILSFLSVALLALPLAACALFSGCRTTATSTTSSMRTETNLNAGWQFAYGVTPTDAQLRSGAVDWPRVHVPHTWNATDGADGGNNYARGTGWYFRKFPTENAWRDRQVFIQFDGANRVAEVFLNGERLGEHIGGYARFRFNLTRTLKPHGENVLAVRVSNAPDNTPPISADFTFFGGIYRSVKLFSVDALHIDVTDHASSGIYITPVTVTTEKAEFDLEVLLRNDTNTAQTVSVRTQIKDARGTVVATAEQSPALSANATTRQRTRLTLAQPRLWNGRADPHRYTAEISVLADGVVRDSWRESFGLRSFHVDPQKGFFLNGRYLDLYGVNRHQDRAGQGWALSPADEREDFALIQELGATAIRVAHYPQSDLWFDLADEHGLVLWAEIPVVNEVPTAPVYLENARQQLRELIRQHYNRPAIMFWGVGNETRQVGEGSGGQAPNPPEPNRVVADLARLAKSEDPTRLSTYASHHRAEDIRHFHTDTLAFNKYIGWYGGKAEDFAAWIDGIHQRFPQLPLGMSEYGAGGSVQQHQIPPLKPAPNGPFHPEEYQSHFHEVYWNTLRTRPYLWGKFIWNMFDFAADDRAEGDHAGINDKGLVTYDRRAKKDAFYWYKANWSAEPVLHLTSKRFVPRPAGATEFKVYSNAPQVELFLDGKSLGVVTSTDHAFRWSVELSAGAHHLVARARHGDTALVDEHHFTSSALPNP